MKASIVLIDGGLLRRVTKAARIPYTPQLIDQFARACLHQGEGCLRILSYDCAPSIGSVILPVYWEAKQFAGSDRWLHELASFDLFAVRRGVLKFRGFERKTAASQGDLTDEDFKPELEQKGVDMRIGLDIAAYSAERLAERIILVTNDTDCVPAMKFAREAGLTQFLSAFQTRILLLNC